MRWARQGERQRPGPSQGCPGAQNVAIYPGGGGAGSCMAVLCVPCKAWPHGTAPRLASSPDAGSVVPGSERQHVLCHAQARLLDANAHWRCQRRTTPAAARCRCRCTGHSRSLPPCSSAVGGGSRSPHHDERGLRRRVGDLGGQRPVDAQRRAACAVAGPATAGVAAARWGLRRGCGKHGRIQQHVQGLGQHRQRSRAGRAPRGTNGGLALWGAAGAATRTLVAAAVGSPAVVPALLLCPTPWAAALGLQGRRAIGDAVGAC